MENPHLYIATLVQKGCRANRNLPPGRPAMTRDSIGGVKMTAPEEHAFRLSPVLTWRPRALGHARSTVHRDGWLLPQ